jgi:hypothetical protein
MEDPTGNPTPWRRSPKVPAISPELSPREFSNQLLPRKIPQQIPWHPNKSMDLSYLSTDIMDLLWLIPQIPWKSPYFCPRKTGLHPSSPSVSSGIQAFSVRLQREVALILVQCPSHGDDRKLGDFSWENLGKFMDILWTSMEINCVWKTIIGLVNQFFFFLPPHCCCFNLIRSFAWTYLLLSSKRGFYFSPLFSNVEINPVLMT